MSASFGKKIYDWPTYRAELLWLIRNRRRVRRVRRAGVVSREFAERLRLAHISVTRCRWCRLLHTRLAHDAGVRQRQIDAILSNAALQEVPEPERAAIAFAYHFAEKDGNPDPEERRRLEMLYGPSTAEAIDITLRLIRFGNLAGNTCDAFLSRLRRRPAPGSGLWFEVFIFLVGMPFLLASVLVAKR